MGFIRQGFLFRHSRQEAHVANISALVSVECPQENYFSLQDHKCTEVRGDHSFRTRQPGAYRHRILYIVHCTASSIQQFWYSEI